MLDDGETFELRTVLNTVTADCSTPGKLLLPPKKNNFNSTEVNINSSRIKILLYVVIIIHLILRTAVCVAPL